MKYLKYFLFVFKYILLVFIIFLTPKVFALEYNMNNKTSAILNGTKNRYLGTEIYNTGTTNTYTFGTRYNGKLSAIDTYFDYPFEANTTYTLTYNMNTEDFRNTFGGKYWWDCSDTMNATNQHNGNFTYVSYKKIKFSFTPTENTTCIRVLLGSTNLSSTAITGVSNWRLDSITLYDPDYQTGSGSGQGTSTPPPNSSNNDTQDIINNNNQNTSDIIENNNNNTKDIIDSQNDNALNELNATRANSVANCSNAFPVNFYKGYYISENDVLVADSSSFYTDYIYLGTGLSQISITNSVNVATPNRYFIFYDINKTKISYTYTSNRVNTIPSGAVYFRLSTNQSALQVFKGGDGCVNNTENFLTDDTNPSISDNEFLTTFNSIGLNDPLSYLLTLPTQLINKIVSLSSSCTSINLGTLYGVMLTMPCINLENIVGSTVWNIIDVIFSVSLLVVIFKNLYDTFSNLLTMGAQKEAKEKFSMPTPMDFLAIILGGDR